MCFGILVCTVLVQKPSRIHTLDQEGGKIRLHPVSTPHSPVLTATSADVRITQQSLWAAVFQANSTQSALARRCEETQLN